MQLDQVAIIPMQTWKVLNVNYVFQSEMAETATFLISRQL